MRPHTRHAGVLQLQLEVEAAASTAASRNRRIDQFARATRALRACVHAPALLCVQTRRPTAPIDQVTVACMQPMPIIQLQLML
jgi:hypothetical protein